MGSQCVLLMDRCVELVTIWVDDDGRGPPSKPELPGNIAEHHVLIGVHNSKIRLQIRVPRHGKYIKHAFLFIYFFSSRGGGENALHLPADLIAVIIDRPKVFFDN